MSLREQFAEEADKLLSYLSTINIRDYLGDHALLDTISFVYVPHVVASILLPLDIVIGGDFHQFIHGQWKDSLRKPKLIQATATLVLQAILAFHRCQIASAPRVGFYVSTWLPTIATLISVIWYAKYGWPPSAIRVFLCGVVFADLGRALGYNSLINEPINIRCYSLLAVVLGSRHLVWPWALLKAYTNWLLGFVYGGFTRFIANEGVSTRLNRFIQYGLRSLSKQSALSALDPTLKPAHLSIAFQDIWETQDKTKPEALLEALKKALYKPAIETVRPRLYGHACQLFLVTLISRVVNSLPRADVQGDRRPLLLVTTTVLACIATMTFDVRRVYANGMFDLKLKGLLSSQVLQKCVQLPANTARSGDSRNILSAEVNQVVGAMPAIHTLWLAPAELAMTLVVFCFYNGLLTLCLVPLLLGALWVASIIIPHQLDITTEWNKQNRVQAAKSISIIDKLKQIRIMRLEDMTLRYLKRFEVRQAALSSSIRLMLAFTLLSVILTAGLLPIASLLRSTTEDATGNGSRGATGATVFVTVALLGMILEPFIFLLKEGSALQFFDQNIVKINQFLCQETHHDNRVVFPTPYRAAPGTFDAVSFRAASIAPFPDMPAVFSDLNIPIKQGTLTIVTGDAAAAISLLLKAIVGEAAILNGQVTIFGKQEIGYCPQDICIFDTSIVRAITCSLRFNATLYQEVTEACMLGHDIQQLSRLDNSPIGTGGSWLSIGLLQRIAIAKAAYAQTGIVVIDNLISTQGEQMACALFQRLLGPDGFFTKRNRTVILATNSVRHFTMASKVIFIDENQSVHQATGQEEIETMVAQKLQTRSIVRDKDECDGFCTKPNEDDRHTPNLRASAYLQPLPPNDGGFSMVGYAALWRLAPKDLLVEWSTLMIMQALFGKVPEALLQLCIETASISDYWIWIYVSTVCVRSLLVAAEGYFQVPEETESVHRDVVHAMMRKPFDTLCTTDISWAFHQALGTSNIAGNGWKISVRASIHAFLLLLCEFVLIATSLPILLLVLPLPILLTFCIHKFGLRTARQLRTLKCTASFNLHSTVGATCKQLQNLRGNSESDRQLGYLLSLLSQEQQVGQTAVEIDAWRQMCQRGVSSIITIATTSVTVFVFPRYSGVSVGFVLLLSNQLWQGVNTMFNSIADLDYYASTASKLHDFIKDVAPQEVQNKGIMDRKYSGAVEFRDVSIDRSTPAQSRTILKHITCKIKPKQNIGIFGRTGSGRTTLFLTLLKQVKYKGSITIDSVELSMIPHHTLNRIVTSIPQRSVDLPGTVRDNLFPWDMDAENPAPTQPSSDDETYKLLNKLDLRGYIQGHGGLDAPVEDMHFTPAQRQLMAIATGCIHHYTHHTKIVLIDESTELLTPQMDNKAHRVIATVFRDCTKFFFAHRQDILRALDAHMNLGDIGDPVDFHKNLDRPPAYATAAECAEARDYDEEDSYDS